MTTSETIVAIGGVLVGVLSALGVFLGVLSKWRQDRQRGDIDEQTTNLSEAWKIIDELKKQNKDQQSQLHDNQADIARLTQAYYDRDADYTDLYGFMLSLHALCVRLLAGAKEEIPAPPLRRPRRAGTEDPGFIARSSQQVAANSDAVTDVIARPGPKPGEKK
jgi:hypothetical protein